MNKLESSTVQYRTKAEARIVFFFVFLGALSLTYGFLFLIDFLPEKPSTGTETGEIVANRDSAASVSDEIHIEGVVSVDLSDITYTGSTDNSMRTTPVYTSSRTALPTRIIFDTLDERSVTVLNPESRSVEVLDTALLSGVVRHPDSADFERTGTILLFGHSSYLPNVLNKNFQAFNGIQKLTWGDTVRLQSSDTEYVYRVDRVYEASASDADVKIETGKSKLTLVTCDSFGAKTDRFVVEASLIESSQL